MASNQMQACLRPGTEADLVLHLVWLWLKSASCLFSLSLCLICVAPLPGPTFPSSLAFSLRAPSSVRASKPIRVNLAAAAARYHTPINHPCQAARLRPASVARGGAAAVVDGSMEARAVPISHLLTGIGRVQRSRAAAAMIMVFMFICTSAQGHAYLWAGCVLPRTCSMGRVQIQCTCRLGQACG